MKRTLTFFLILILPSLACAAPEPPEITVTTSGTELIVSGTEVPDAAGYRLYYAP